MNFHFDLIVKNVDYGGRPEETAQAVREALEEKLKELGIQKDIGEINMVDVPRNNPTGSTTTNVFVCFERYFLHESIAKMLNGVVPIYGKRPEIESCRRRATHGAEYLQRTYVRPSYHPYVVSSNVAAASAASTSAATASAASTSAATASAASTSAAAASAASSNAASMTQPNNIARCQIEMLRSALNLSRAKRQSVDDENQRLRDENGRLKAELFMIKQKLERARNELQE